jgi:hypothetical protein
MTRIELAHVVAADAPSVALVLAGPAARDLWPQADESTPMIARQGPAYEITLDPPSRAGIGFVARLAVTAGEVAVGSGRLTIVPASGDHGQCDVRLTLTAKEDAGGTLRRAVGQYLRNVGEVSRARSTAA